MRKYKPMIGCAGTNSSDVETGTEVAKMDLLDFVGLLVLWALASCWIIVWEYGFSSRLKRFLCRTLTAGATDGDTEVVADDAESDSNRLQELLKQVGELREHVGMPPIEKKVNAVSTVASTRPILNPFLNSKFALNATRHIQRRLPPLPEGISQRFGKRVAPSATIVIGNSPPRSRAASPNLH